jgi:hypothetical protein
MLAWTLHADIDRHVVPFSTLFDHATGDPGATTAKRGGLIGIVVTTGMDHQRVAAQCLDILDPRRDEALGRGAVREDLQYRQIANVTLPAWSFMLAGMIGVQVPAGGSSGGGRAIHGTRTAVAVRVNMEAVRTRGQALQIHIEDGAIGGFCHPYRADFLADTLGGDLVHRRHRIGGVSE